MKEQYKKIQNLEDINNNVINLYMERERERERERFAH
jgi:hypothetical protein